MTKVVFLFVLLIFSNIISAEADKHLNIYLNADMSGTKISGESIEMGIRVALSEIDFNIAGYSIKVIVKDHHGNSLRSLKYLEEFISDENALVTYSGLHSPPIINNLNFINNNGIPMLIPWAAAGSITRTTDEKGLNWVYRLSVDDTQAAEVITSFAIDREKFKKPLLLLENTGWGKSNYSSLTKALLSRGIKNSKTIWFSWGIKSNGSRVIIDEIIHGDNDSIFFVGNSPEGITFFNTLSQLAPNNRLPIRSHWGITGGNFFNELGAEIITEELDLKFIQTTFSFLNNTTSTLALEVFNRLMELYPYIEQPKDLKAPNGFIHAYDLTKILIQAIKQVDLTDDIKENRTLIRAAMENLQEPVEGLIKTYIKPFGVFTQSNMNAHEALNIGDFTMAKYNKDGSIEVLYGE